VKSDVCFTKNEKMEELIMKKRLVLGILAAVLSLTLGIGGTLMFFSDVSETATNVVTLGEVSGLLAESDLDNATFSIETKGGDYKIVGLEYAGEKFTGLTDFMVNRDGDPNTGVDGKESFAAPGDSFVKKPLVYNDGELGAYVMVRAILRVKEASGGYMSLDNVFDELQKAGIIENASELKKPVIDTSKPQVAADLKAAMELLGEFFPTVTAASSTSDGWWGSSTQTFAGTDTKGPKLITGDFYFVDNAENLAELPTKEFTPDVFKEFKIPDGLDGFEGATFEVELTAYLVQAANNTPGGKSEADYANVFAFAN
jgi:predicted ribosomally synthesized peptide with SipW-like signal peptide